MARVPVSPGPRIAQQPLAARAFRPTDISAVGRAAGEGLRNLGTAGMEFARAEEDLEALAARAEANRLAVERTQLERAYSRKVKQSLGEDAEVVGRQAATDLEKDTRALLGRASPRARGLLQLDFAERNGAALDRFNDHIFSEKVKAVESSSEARFNSEFEAVRDIDDEAEALEQFQQRVLPVIGERDAFFGESAATTATKQAKALSAFRVSRAQRIAREKGANAARDYVMAHGQEIDDEAFNRFLDAYENEALAEDGEGFADIFEATNILGGKATYYEPSAQEAKERDPKPRDETPNAGLWQGREITSGIGRRTAPSTGGGRRGSSNHKGLDIAYRAGEAVPAMMSGIARVRSDPDGYGQYVEIDHGNGLKTRYAHLSAFSVRNGQQVSRGQTIGRAGSTGNSSGPHLHLEALVEGRPVDPRTLGQRTVYRGGSGIGSAQGQGEITAATTWADIDLAPHIAAIRADDSLTFKQKQSRIDALKRRQSEAQGLRADREATARRAADETVGKLGDDFTDISAIPAGVWTELSPSDRRQFRDLARNNVRSEPPSDALLDYITLTKISNPQHFLSDAFIADITKRGASASLIRDVQGEQRTVLAGVAAGKDKPAPVSGSRLWTVAEPAFKAAGLHFDTVEAKKPGDKQAEIAEDHQRKMNAVRFLEQAWRDWANANPGKEPDDETIRRWVGTALIRTSHGSAVGTLSDAELVTRMPAEHRLAVNRALKDAGVPRSVASVASAYRRWLAANGARGR